MKLTGVLSVVLLLAFFCGCGLNATTDPQIVFYYPSVELASQTNHAGLTAQAMSGISTRDIGELISQYLCGPEAAHLYSPFMPNVRLLRWSQNDNVLELIFTDTLSQMSAQNITLACAALSATLFQVEQIQEISIRCETAQLNSRQALTFTPESISWLDNISTDVIAETEAIK